VKSYPGGIRHDYNESPGSPPPAYWRHWSLFAAGLTVPIVMVTFLLMRGPDQGDSLQARTPAFSAPAATVQTSSSAPNSLLPPQLSLLEGVSEEETKQAGEMLALEIRRGDTLESLFRRNGLKLADLAAMVRLPEAGEHLRMLRPGDKVAIRHDGDTVLSLEREIDNVAMLSIARDEDGYRSTIIDRPVEYRVVGGQGGIDSSLFAAATKAGVSDAVIMRMAQIFQWDIDFIQDVRLGDHFTVLYEEIWRDGVKLGDGQIVAAEFVNQGKSFRAARYTDGEGRTDYYTPEGRSVRKAFVRAPVDFTRISGNFNPNRKHPILNTIRAHRGVDYAAPSGTPVRAAGDGKVISRGRNGGFGNAVVLQHGGNITTLYAHLSRFADPKVGNRVKQGEIIGYVGQTGLATGPHLHYEYRVNGVHRDPRTVSLPPADPVNPRYQEDFQTVSASLWSQLDLYKRAWIARNIE